MSLLDIKMVADKLTAEERLMMMAHLRHVGRVDTPQRKAALGSQMRAMDEGRKIPLDAVIRTHSELKAAGF